MINDCDLRSRAYIRRWFLAHPGYGAASSKRWREEHPGQSNPGRASRLYRDLENWRARCRQAGVVPPKESYWRNRKRESQSMSDAQYTPGYNTLQSRRWRAAHLVRPVSLNRTQEQIDLENWRRRCKRAGVVPPKESYWLNRKR